MFLFYGYEICLQEGKMKMERVTINCSNLLRSSKLCLFGLDDYIKEYLQTHPELSFGSQLYIILRELITSDLILQLKEFMIHTGILSFSKPYVMNFPGRKVVK